MFVLQEDGVWGRDVTSPRILDFASVNGKFQTFASLVQDRKFPVTLTGWHRTKRPTHCGNFLSVVRPHLSSNHS
jgi:hypothetical protein